MTYALSLQDINTIEDGAEKPIDFYAAVQRAINSGTAWSLQGFYGRVMMEAIQNGYCMLGFHGASDYYGNRIPSRNEVQDGTLGSYDYVAERQGEDWAHDIAWIGKESLS